MSTTWIKRVKLYGTVDLNGVHARVIDRVCTGDRLYFEYEDNSGMLTPPSNVGILFENEHYAVHVGSKMTLYQAFAEEYGNKYNFSYLAQVETLEEATDYLRNYATELGNNFSIIETRQNFTESLIDVLETGADNLVLADMNEESANYLALQTRQQLAINSLALASQSAQSVLSLFQ